MKLHLEELIPTYYELKTQADSLNEELKKQNSQIKDLMLNSELKEKTAGGYKALCLVSTRESMNEEKLLRILHEHPELAKELIRTREYVDMDALENAIYKGAIPNELLQEISTCRESKEVVTLKVSKVKE